MQVEVAPTPVSAKAFEALARLQQLTLETGLSSDLKQLIFRILNRSIIYCRYERAVLWGLAGHGVRLLGVSGNAKVDQRSSLVTEWQSLLDSLPDRRQAAILDAHKFNLQRTPWDTLAKRTAGLSVVWLPITVEGRVVAGLWLERWGDNKFNADELAQLETLALAYGVAWRSVAGNRGALIRWLSTRRRVTIASVSAMLCGAMCFVTVPLRIVAPCEIIPKEPVAVIAPINGVIDEVLAQPGRPVEQGDLLVVYDKRVPTEEMKVAREQVRIIESELQRTRVQAFDRPSARTAIALLRNRLEQEKIRLRIAQLHVDQLEILAPVSGTPMLDDPHEWRGRPVQIGQRLMMIVDPASTKLYIRLPDSDNIDFDLTKPVSVVLDSDPRSSRSAKLRYVSNHSRIGKDSMPHFRAEAEWVNREPDVKLGLQGTAVLYGQRVSLGYWLLRRPLGAVRKYLGI